MPDGTHEPSGSDLTKSEINWNRQNGSNVYQYTGSEVYSYNSDFSGVHATVIDGGGDEFESPSNIATNDVAYVRVSQPIPESLVLILYVG